MPDLEIGLAYGGRYRVHCSGCAGMDALGNWVPWKQA